MVAEQSQQIEAQSVRLEKQQQTIEMLLRGLEHLSALAAANPQRDGAGPAPAALAALASAPAMALAAPQAPQQTPPQDDVTRRIEERIARIGPFVFSGDFRLRDEPFFGGPASGSLDRHRLRLRARLNMNARLNEDISGGITLSAGHIEDPITINQDLDQFFTRKPFQIDRAFLAYTPHQFHPLNVTVGKFAYPWYHTELTWDNDLSVEGVAQTLNFSFEKSSLLKRLAVVSFALPFAQTTGINFNFPPGYADHSIHQSVVYGGQVQSEWQLAGWLKFGAYSAFYDWHNADPIALSLNTPNPASPGRGTLRLSGSNVQNSMTVWTQSTAVPAAMGGAILVNTSIVNAQFASKFALFDNIARFDISTKSPLWPVTVIADFVQNTKACANLVNFFAPPPAPGATVAASASAPCNPHDRQGYWLEARAGRLSEAHDWQFAYTRMFIEREAVLSAFNYSDIRQGSNVSQHRAEVFYNPYRNVTLGFTGLFGRPLGPLPLGETVLKRLQLDVFYRF